MTIILYFYYGHIMIFSVAFYLPKKLWNIGVSESASRVIL